MFRDSYRNRKKYYITLFVSIYVIIFTALALIVWANWGFIKSVFEKKEEQLSVEQYEFNEIFERVCYLEELSKKYNEENYQLRTVAYIRDTQYSGSVWDMLFTENLTNFDTYVKKNQGDKKVTELRELGKGFAFTVPKTKEKVDFYHMFAVLNAVMVGNTNLEDLAGWGGDICQLATEYQNVTITEGGLYEYNGEELTGDELYNKIKTSMNSTSSFGVEDRNADIDAVNIYSIMNSNSLYNSVYACTVVYYSSFTTENKNEMFKNYLGIENKTVESSVDVLYERLTTNMLLPTMISAFGLYYQADENAEDYNKCQTIYNYCIKAFVECLN